MALSDVIEASHITDLQRVNGMWRIYVDNLDDKVTLLKEGVRLRGKNITLLRTNPDRLDGENTLSIRVKNVPLSVDDEVITRTLVLKGIDVISCIRERLRIHEKLTNCETGDRLYTVKRISLKEPLPKYMIFGKFGGRVIHFGQDTRDSATDKCTKCLETGHRFSTCPNEIKCQACLKTGHKKGECVLNATPVDTPKQTDTSTSNDMVNTNGKFRAARTTN